MHINFELGMWPGIGSFVFAGRRLTAVGSIVSSWFSP